MKKFFCLGMVIVLILALTPAMAASDSDFVIRDGVLYGYTGSGGEVVIPGGVTKIGDRAFWKCTTITGVVIPDSVTWVYDYAFAGCTSLASVSIPDSVTAIGNGMFQGCTSLTGIRLPDTLTVIDNNAFYECSSLTDINIPEKVDSIGSNAFYGCAALASLTIPASVTTMGHDIFSGCTQLTIYCDAGSRAQQYAQDYRIPFISGDATTASDFWIIGDTLVQYKGNGGNVTIPSTVKKIGDQAFRNCAALTGIVIPNGVDLGEGIFFGCTSLVSVTLPNGIVEIKRDMFSGCTSLSSIKIPETVTAIGVNAFAGCHSLSDITIPKGVKSIGDYAFSICKKLINITLPSGVTGIGDYAFSFCYALERITIPSSVVSIGEDVFFFSSAVTVYGSNGSKAQAYAKEYNISFVAETSAATTVPTAAVSTAVPTSSTVLVNGKNVSFDAYTIDGNNYFKLRDLAYVLSGTEKQFNVSWDGVNNAIRLTSGAPYTVIGGEMQSKGAGSKSPKPTTSAILINGSAVSLTAYEIDGNNYFKLREIGAAFDFEVDWDGAKNTIVIDTAKSYTPD